jgi:hypothetical protein
MNRGKNMIIERVVKSHDVVIGVITEDRNFLPTDLSVSKVSTRILRATDAYPSHRIRLGGAEKKYVPSEGKFLSNSRYSTFGRFSEDSLIMPIISAEVMEYKIERPTRRAGFESVEIFHHNKWFDYWIVSDTTLKIAPYCHAIHLFLKKAVTKILNLPRKFLIPYPPRNVTVFGVENELIGLYAGKIICGVAAEDLEVLEEKIQISSGTVWKTRSSILIPHFSVSFDKLKLEEQDIRDFIAELNLDRFRKIISLLADYYVYNFGFANDEGLRRGVFGIDIPNKMIHFPKIWKKQAKLDIEFGMYDDGTLISENALTRMFLSPAKNKWLPSLLEEFASKYDSSDIKSVRTIPRFIYGNNLRFYRASQKHPDFANSPDEGYEIISKDWWFADEKDDSVMRKLDGSFTEKIGAEFCLNTRSEIFNAVDDILLVSDLSGIIVDFMYDGFREDLVDGFTWLKKRMIRFGKLKDIESFSQTRRAIWALYRELNGNIYYHADDAILGEDFLTTPWESDPNKGRSRIPRELVRRPSITEQGEIQVELIT